MECLNLKFWENSSKYGLLVLNYMLKISANNELYDVYNFNSKLKYQIKNKFNIQPIVYYWYKNEFLPTCNINIL